mmetsp:Transcript_19126/g.60771  ORF Transcript_19126/g.60771 Transcript_19126/m.60771 type:complete len:559 (+) Transcript_19126:140-1816(+)
MAAAGRGPDDGRERQPRGLLGGRVRHLLAQAVLVDEHPVRGRLVALDELQQGPQEHFGHVRAHHVVLQRGHEGDREEHAREPQQRLEQHDQSHHDHGMHPHELPSPRRVHLHLDDVARQHLEEDEEEEQQHAVDVPLLLVDAPVEQDRGQHQREGHERAYLREVVQQEGDDEENVPQLAAEAREHDAHEAREEHADHGLQQQVGPEDLGHGAAHGQGLAEPEGEVDEEEHGLHEDGLHLREAHGGQLLERGGQVLVHLVRVEEALEVPQGVLHGGHELLDALAVGLLGVPRPEGVHAEPDEGDEDPDPGAHHGHDQQDGDAPGEPRGLVQLQRAPQRPPLHRAGALQHRGVVSLLVQEELQPHGRLLAHAGLGVALEAVGLGRRVVRPVQHQPVHLRQLLRGVPPAGAFRAEPRDAHAPPAAAREGPAPPVGVRAHPPHQGRGRGATLQLHRGLPGRGGEGHGLRAGPLRQAQQPGGPAATADGQVVDVPHERRQGQGPEGGPDQRQQHAPEAVREVHEGRGADDQDESGKAGVPLVLLHARLQAAGDGGGLHGSPPP